MFSHVHVGIADFTRSYDFYRAVLGELEIEVKIYRPDQSWRLGPLLVRTGRFSSSAFHLIENRLHRAMDT